MRSLAAVEESSNANALPTWLAILSGALVMKVMRSFRKSVDTPSALASPSSGPALASARICVVVMSTPAAPAARSQSGNILSILSMTFCRIFACSATAASLRKASG